MKSRRTKIIVAVAAVLLLLAAFGVTQTVRRVHMREAFGETGMDGRGMFGRHMLHFFADYLDMTDAQQAQAKQILDRERPTLRPLYQQLAQQHHQLRQVIETGTFDEAQVRAIATQQAQTMTELTVQHARVASELVQILTPEQKTKLARFLDKHERRFRRRMQPDQAQPDGQQNTPDTQQN